MAYFGYSLWLVGVDAPTAQKTYFKMSKSSKEKYSSVCLDILCSQFSHNVSWNKKIMADVKKTVLNAPK
jgi:hypothetical protein